MSRTKHFRKMFENYISEHCIKTGKICSWELKLLTENTRKNTHDYQLNIPFKYLAYTLDKQVILADGTTEGPGPIYLPQDIPCMKDFIEEARSYFAEFEYVENGKMLSGVNIGLLKIQENGDNTIDVQVVYNADYHPYGVPITQTQMCYNMLHENMRLLGEVRELEKLLNQRELALSKGETLIRMLEHHIRSDAKEINVLTQQNQKYKYKTAKLEAAFKTLATEKYAKGEPENCPVCYEIITAETLHANTCGHNICDTCNVKCTRCPMCRELY